MAQSLPSDASNWTLRQGLGYALQPAVILRSLFAGAIIWLVFASVTPSYSKLIFQGKLSGYFAAGLAMALVSQLIVTLVTSLFSSDHATISLVQSPSAVIQGLLAGAVISAAPADMPEEALFSLVFFFIALSSVLSGLFVLLLGITRVGDFVRYIPYPIVGGFMAGLGWLMLNAGFVVSADLRINVENLGLLLEGEAILRWLPSLALALCILALGARVKSAAIMPSAIIVSLILFYAWARFVYGDPRGLEEAGWFLPKLPEVIYWKIPDLSAVGLITPAMILAGAGGIVMTIAQCALNLFFKASAQEIITERELDFNQECRVNGVANVAAGVFGGGVVGYHTPSMTTVVETMRAYGRLTGFILAIMFGLSLVFGSFIYAIIPRFLPAGLLMFVGLLFLKQWLLDSRFKLPRQDYVVVAVIALVTAAFGLLAGFFVGVVVAIALFVLEYSRMDVIKQEFSGSIHRSNLDRSFAQNQLLQQEGDKILILRLQGYIFFGTAYRFYEHLRSRITSAEGGQLGFIILDFKSVRGFDVSTMVDFQKLKKLTAGKGIKLLVSNAAPHLHTLLADGGITQAEPGYRASFDDLDRALEWCESILLQEADLLDAGRVDLEEQLAQHAIIRQRDARAVQAFLERMATKVGDTIFKQGDESDSLYFVESGRVDVLLRDEAGHVLRLRSMTAGAVIGEVGFYLGNARSASIVVTEAGVLQRLSHEALRRMEETAPQTASAVHVLIASLLSHRLSTTNRLVQELMD
ncbi:MAG: cyclic nucleotide-binding domain-containing protein [Chloroflexota bacterium]|nr:cyclic nucleotide-binding domain-containing protein [Chloroflexota bacterium]MDE2910305.1 cyclic nucleotide-binding domain-containing protein [Chloroflexota bacterium]